MSQNAVIYIRVSDKSQVNQGHGLESQQLRCEQFCENKGYEIQHIFSEEGVSGGTMDRPQLRLLFSYLGENPKTVVVIDDLKRLSRSVTDFLLLTEQVKKLDCTIEYLNHTFDDSPESEFIQVILAGAGQLERRQNARAVKQKQKARLESGYWILNQPKGYKFQRVDGSKLLVPDETAPVIKEVLESFALGTLTTHAEIIAKFKSHNLTIAKDYVKQFLTCVIYTGYIEYPKWEIKLTLGKHQALISFETHERIKAIILGKDPRTLKQGIHVEDFSLRKFIKCGECGKNISGHWLKNKTIKSYYCFNRNCNQYKHHINGTKLEKAFSELLKNTNLDNDDIQDIRDILTNESYKLIDQAKKTLQSLRKDQVILDSNIKTQYKLLESCTSPNVFKTVENRIDNLEKSKILLCEKLLKIETQNQTSQMGILTSIDRVLAYLKNLDRFWTLGDLDIKRTVYETVFDDGLSVSINTLNEIVLTPSKGCFYAICRQIKAKNTGWCNLQGFIPNFNLYNFVVRVDPYLALIKQDRFDRILA